MKIFGNTTSTNGQQSTRGTKPHSIKLCKYTIQHTNITEKAPENIKQNFMSNCQLDAKTKRV